MITSSKINTLKNLRYLLPMLAVMLLFSCKKKSSVPDPPPVDGGDETIINPTDPAPAKTVGFFLDDWKARTFTTPTTFDPTAAPTLTNPTDIVIDASEVIAKVPAAIFGQNSVSFVDPISGHAETMTHLKNLKPTVIRFPGGSISNSYFFNRNMNDRPADAPTVMINSNGTEVPYANNYWYGKGNGSGRANLEDYYAILQQTGSEGMLCVNYSYARYGLSNDPVAQAAKLAADWVRFDNGRTKYWAIGNENYGGWEQGYRIKTATNKDGQPEYLSGELYAKHAKVFIQEMRKAAAEIGKTIYIGVPLVETQLYSYDWLYQTSLAAREWNKGILTEMKDGGANTPDFYEVHNYYINNDETGYGVILNSAQTKTSAMATFLDTEFKRYASPAKPIALTEYNIAATGSLGQMQQVSFVNGMHTTIVLGEAIKNNFGSAVRWDLFNAWEGGADHGMFDKGDEPGGRRGNPRPVFYYMYYFQKLFGDRMLKSTSAKSTILPYASSFTSGQKSVVLVNKNTTEQPVKISIKHAEKATKFYWYVLTGGTDNGEFSRSVYVNGVGPESGKTGGPLTYANINPRAASATQGTIQLMLPARSVVYVVAEK